MRVVLPRFLFHTRNDFQPSLLVWLARAHWDPCQESLISDFSNAGGKAVEVSYSHERLPSSW